VSTVLSFPVNPCDSILGNSCKTLW
jgi:hypothetical protein